MLKKTGLIALGTISSIFAVSCSNNGVGQNTDNDNKVSGDNSSSAPVITREYCADFFAPVQTMDINVLRDTKKTLCDITKTKLNEEGYKPVNAFSSMQNINIQFHKSQGSFSIFQNDGLLSTSMGVGDWIANSSNPEVNIEFNANKKVFAFGETPTSLVPGASGWGIWDIRFIDAEGKVLAAKTAYTNGFLKNTAKYYIEADLGKEYISNVYATFALGVDKEVAKNVYFLKTDGTYDIKAYKASTSTYEDVSIENRISDLFPMIPLEEISSIDYVQKISANQIALFKKTLDGKYDGYYLISSENLLKMDKNVNTVYVSLAEKITDENLSDNSTSDKKAAKEN